MDVVTVGLGLSGTMFPTPGSAFVGVTQAQLARTVVRFFTSAEPVGTIATVLTGSALLVRSILLVRKHMKDSTASMRTK